MVGCIPLTKTRPKSVLYPQRTKPYQYVVMQLVNLAKPKWTFISCNQKALCYILCYKVNRSNELFLNIKSVKDYFICSTNSIIIKQTCHIFLWFNSMNSTRNICQQFNSFSVNITRISSTKQVFDALSLENKFP